MKRHRQPLRPMSDINITNLLDTAFILIVALMLVAPQLSQGVKLDLPEVEAAPLDNEPNKTVIVSVQKRDPLEDQERIYVGNTRMTVDDLYSRIEQEKRQRPDVVIQVEADKDASYGAMFEVLDAIKRAGVENIDLSSKPGDGSDKDQTEESEKTKDKQSLQP